MVLRKPFLVELEFGNVGFKEDGEKPEEREKTSRDKVGIQQPRGRGGGVLPYKRLMGMRRWKGSHFHNWIDYNGVAFSIELLEWGRTFSDFLG